MSRHRSSRWHSRFTLVLLLTVFYLGVADNFAGGRPVQASPVEILTPRPGTTIVSRTPEASLVLRQPEQVGASQPKVKTGVSVLEPLGIWQLEGKNYLHFQLPLKPGKNTFTITSDGKSFEVNYQPLRSLQAAKSPGKDVHFFHQSDNLPKDCSGCHQLGKKNQSGHPAVAGRENCASCHRKTIRKATWQHSPQVNDLCLACHQLSTEPGRFGFPDGKIEEICFRCHTSKKSWMNKKHVHGPMVTGGCTLCHNPHGDENRHQLWAEGTTELCVACHSDKKGLVEKNSPVRFVHGVIQGPGCVVCHDPHASDHPTVLRKAINPLCTSCHTRLSGITRGHPVGGHPVQGPSERRRPGRELTCASCHDPHGSPYMYMLIGDNLGGHVCAMCHK